MPIIDEPDVVVFVVAVEGEAEEEEHFFFGNARQNRSVSSPAPVTIVSPSGDMAKYNTTSSKQARK
jgi:hypothetical protein